MDRMATTRRCARGIGLGATIVAAAVAWRFAGGSAACAMAPPSRPAARTPAAAPASPPAAHPVALVNGTEITRDRLAAECLGRHGAGVLETLVNRRLTPQST